MSDYHQSVLLQEAMQYLDIQPKGIYIDATFGRGGHSKAILERLGGKGFLLAIDKDRAAIDFASEHFRGYDNFSLRQGSFTMLQTFVNEMGFAQKISGILLDLGVSSPQLDDPSRGFSFLQDGPLDMRMDLNQILDAATWINEAEEQEIATILWRYGEEKFGKRIAKAIVQERSKEPITRTKKLAEIIAKANPAWEKHKHPATRSFQAIRIYLNHELQELEACLEQSLSVLAVGGRLVVISFHSLEDKIVKRFIQKQERGGEFPRDLPITKEQFHPSLKRIAWGVTASHNEVVQNPRSRSAIMRVAEKLQ